VGGQLHSPAILLPVPIEQEAGWGHGNEDNSALTESRTPVIMPGASYLAGFNSSVSPFSANV
jgi:hypothetical protein